MMIKKIFASAVSSLGILSMLTVSLPQVAFADGISAGGCIPIDTTNSFVRLKQSSGAWVFNSGKKGTARLRCDVGLVGGFINGYQVHFRDSDNAGIGTKITTRFEMRTVDGAFIVSPAVELPGTNSGSWELGSIPLGLPVPPDAVLSIRIDMKRATTSDTIALGGIIVDSAFSLPPLE